VTLRLIQNIPCEKARGLGDSYTDKQIEFATTFADQLQTVSMKAPMVAVTAPVSNPI
jgi:hypothetical protein